ncbi:MAG: carbohydrate kinase family protein [Pseudomonadota bacterium]
MRSLHFGSAMVDIITLVASDEIERLTLSNEGAAFLLLETGRKVPARSITTHIGGGGCNTAVSLARRGWTAEVCAKIGDDLNAAAVRAHLADNHVADGLIASPAATGTAVMVASHDRNASIFVHRGANETLIPDEVPDMRGRDLVYVAPLSSGSADCFTEIVSQAASAGAKVAVNPGIRQLTSRLPPFLQALERLELISINRVEAEALIPAIVGQVAPAIDRAASDDAPALVRRGLRAGGLRYGVVEFLQGFRSLGPNWVCLTDGTDGAYLAGPDGVLWHPSPPAEVAGTAGAGDAFCSTLTAGLLEGLPPEQAARQASLNSASVVGHVDTTTGLLTDQDLAQRDADAPAAEVLWLA